MFKKFRKKKIGLALGGGAVLGAAHVGVLKALEENDITVSYITGTSIGAFVAALFAFNQKWSAIEKLALDLSWMDISKLSLSQYGLLSNEKMGAFITEHIGNKTMDQADIPLAMIATDITNGEKVVLNSGNVADAVMASACIPGIYKPVKLNGSMLVDGGIVENVPVSPLKDMGANYIIGVDLNTKRTNKEPENIIDLMLNSFHFTLYASAKMQTRKADLLIQPDLSAFSRSKTNQTKALIEKGYEEAIKKLKKMD